MKWTRYGLVWKHRILPGSRPFRGAGSPRGNWPGVKLSFHLEARASGLESLSLLFSPGRTHPTSRRRAPRPRPRREGRDGRERGAAPPLPSTHWPPPRLSGLRVRLRLHDLPTHLLLRIRSPTPPPLHLCRSLQLRCLASHSLQPLGLSIDLQPRLKLSTCEFSLSFSPNFLGFVLL